MMTTSNCQVPCVEVKELSLLTRSSVHIAICEVSKKYLGMAFLESLIGGFV
jgi:hypothetical protein